MTTSPVPASTLQLLPLVSTPESLLPIVDSGAACCGGSCSLGD